MLVRTDYRGADSKSVCDGRLMVEMTHSLKLSNTSGQAHMESGCKAQKYQLHLLGFELEPLRLVLYIFCCFEL